MQVRDQHAVERAGVGGVGDLAAQVHDAARSTGSVSSRAPPVSSSTVACPSHVTRSGMMSRHPRLQDTRRMSLGPLQVLIVNFDETNFSGEIEAEMRRLEEAGTLRVLDVARGGQDPTRARSRWSAHEAEIAQALLGDGPGLEEPTS